MSEEHHEAREPDEPPAMGGPLIPPEAYADPFQPDDPDAIASMYVPYIGKEAAVARLRELCRAASSFLELVPGSIPVEGQLDPLPGPLAGHASFLIDRLVQMLAVSPGEWEGLARGLGADGSAVFAMGHALNEIFSRWARQRDESRRLMEHAIQTSALTPAKLRQVLAAPALPARRILPAELAVLKQYLRVVRVAVGLDPEQPPAYLGVRPDEARREVRRDGYEAVVRLGKSPLYWNLVSHFVESQDRLTPLEAQRHLWQKSGLQEDPEENAVNSGFYQLNKLLKPLDVAVRAHRRIGRSLVDVASRGTEDGPAERTAPRKRPRRSPPGRRGRGRGLRF